MRVNRDKFLAVEVPGAGYRVLLTPEGQLGGGLTFLDPQGRQALLISHAEQRCTGVKALDAATSAACEGAERVRASVHAAMSRYAADKVLRASSCATVAARLWCTAEGRDGGEERPKGGEGRQRRTAVVAQAARAPPPPPPPRRSCRTPPSPHTALCAAASSESAAAELQRPLPHLPPGACAR